MRAAARTAGPPARYGVDKNALGRRGVGVASRPIAPYIMQASSRTKKPNRPLPASWRRQRSHQPPSDPVGAAQFCANVGTHRCICCGVSTICAGTWLAARGRKRPSQDAKDPATPGPH
jgi:hypothetical protein